MKHPENSFY